MLLLLNRTDLQSAALKIQSDGPTVMLTHLCMLTGSSAVKHSVHHSLHVDIRGMPSDQMLFFWSFMEPFLHNLSNPCGSGSQSKLDDVAIDPSSHHLDSYTVRI